MIKIGEYNKLKIAKKVDFGVYLDAGEDGEILMPRKYVPETCEAGDEVDALIYTDSEDRLVATTEKPLVYAGGLAALKVKQITDFGAFLDWGITKDLLLPFSEQTRTIAEGDVVVVYAYADNKSRRMAATMKWEKHADYNPDTETIVPGAECEITVAGQTDIGFKVLVDGRYYGLVYANEVFSDLKNGETRKAYIRKIREDGKMDISLSPVGFLNKIGGDTDKIVGKLQAAGGFLPTTDKSPAEVIYSTYGISKKSYKQAVGRLYKQHVIELMPDGIRLVRH